MLFHCRLYMMEHLVICISIWAVLGEVTSYRYYNETVPEPASQQLAEFRYLHPKSIGVYTKVSGEPLDVRDMTTLNTDIFNNRHHFRVATHHVREKLPERIFYAKGAGAFGYFEVTHDVSKYIKSDVFNGIGKKTPLVARLSTAFQNIGGSDLRREPKALSVKMYTNEGNLDIVCHSIPIFIFKDPVLFPKLLHAYKRNPRTNIMDDTARWDFINLNVDILHARLYMGSDLGLPAGYSYTNQFAVHAYEIYNIHGDRFFAKFNFRSELGLRNMTDAQAQAIAGEDPDYFTRDLYNAIAQKKYPSWRLEIDILTLEEVLKLDYDPFDVTRVWKRGTYRTIPIGRLVLNRRVDSHFRDVDQLAFSPDNLVPGFGAPVDALFRARKIFYTDAQNYRLGSNFDNIHVNRPLYDKTYSRDGRTSLLDNMRDVPNFFPNSFNGPMPYIEEARPDDNIIVYHRNAVDLQPMAEFYNEILESYAHRQRVANWMAVQLRTVPWDVEKNAISIMTLIDKDLGRRVRAALAEVRAEDIPARQQRVAQCIADVTRIDVNPFKQYSDTYEDVHQMSHKYY